MGKLKNLILLTRYNIMIYFRKGMKNGNIGPPK